MQHDFFLCGQRSLRDDMTPTKLKLYCYCCHLMNTDLTVDGCGGVGVIHCAFVGLLNMHCLCRLILFSNKPTTTTRLLSVKQDGDL
jgi:hypothetical protein